MKKLLLTLIAAFAISISVNAQAAKSKKLTLTLNDVSSKTDAEKKAKYDEMQKYKKQVDLDALKPKQTAKTKTVKVTPTAEIIN